MRDFDAGPGLRPTTIGCLVALGLAVALAGAGVLVGHLALRDATRADADPARLERRARELVGGALPEGYRGAGLFDLPGVLEVVVLTTVDRPEAALDPEADPRLVLVTARRPSRHWGAFLADGSSPREALAPDGIVIDGRIEASGVITWSGVSARWIAVDGPVTLPGDRSLGGRALLLLPSCAGRPARLAAWQPAGYPALGPEVRLEGLLEIVRPLAPCW